MREPARKDGGGLGCEEGWRGRGASVRGCGRTEPREAAESTRLREAGREFCIQAEPDVN